MATTNQKSQTTSQPPLLEYRHVSKSYGHRAVLRDINLHIPYGKIIGLLGKNGTGKTTLIKLANDLLTPTSGDTNFNHAKAVTLLQDLDLDLNMKISKISKGMQEKLQLILVMSREAKLYILDEPLGGIDPATRDYILDTILNNFQEGASVLISTHLIADIERILDEVIFINNGHIMLQGEADKIRTEQHQSIDEIFRQQFKNPTHKLQKEL